jgi:proteasome lid subunit RPN8/RPN11
MIDEIEEHLKAEYPREGCGVIGVVRGKEKWFPCANIAEGDEDFILDSREYAKINATCDIIAIVHSHPDSDCTPSQADIDHCNALGVKYHIFSYPEMDMYTVEPEVFVRPLLGREYKFGISDCFEAARDYYLDKGIELPRRDAYVDDWWLLGLDYFTEEYIRTWDFIPVVAPQEGDLLIFAIDSEVGNHCGVYLGNEIFFHHAQNRLSCRESLHPVWAKGLIGIYRYDA